MIKRTFAPALAVLAALSIISSCKGESVAEAAVSAASGGKVAMDIGKDGTMNVKGPDGANVVIGKDGQIAVKGAQGQTMTTTLGAQAANDFPLALPAGVQVQASVKTQTPEGMAHQLSATAPSGDVKSLADHLESEAKAKGYTVKRTDANAGGMQTSTLQLSGAGNGTLSVTKMGGQIIVGGTLVKK